MKVIGITGRARAGKDSLASQFVQLGGFKKYSFARPIKAASNLMFGWDERHSEGDLKEVVDPFFGFSPRFAYQTLGTEWGRKILRDDIWIRVAEKFVSENEYVVIPDVRFDNEAQFILKQQGLLIQIVRHDQPLIALNAHASEAGIAQKYLENALVVHNDISKLESETLLEFDARLEIALRGFAKAILSGEFQRAVSAASGPGIKLG